MGRKQRARSRDRTLTGAVKGDGALDRVAEDPLKRNVN